MFKNFGQLLVFIILTYALWLSLIVHTEMSDSHCNYKNLEKKFLILLGVLFVIGCTILISMIPPSVPRTNNEIAEITIPDHLSDTDQSFNHLNINDECPLDGGCLSALFNTYESTSTLASSTSSAAFTDFSQSDESFVQVTEDQ